MIEEFSEFPFPDGLTQIDATFVNATAEKIQVGDILVFLTLSEPPIIAHRVIKKWNVKKTVVEREYVDSFPQFFERNVTKYYFSTVGDNWFSQPYEREIEGKRVVGKILTKGPYLDG